MAKKNAFPSAIGVTAYLSNADCKWQTKHEPENEQKKTIQRKTSPEFVADVEVRTLSVVRNKRACALKTNTSSPAEKFFIHHTHSIDVVSQATSVRTHHLHDSIFSNPRKSGEMANCV